MEFLQDSVISIEALTPSGDNIPRSEVIFEGGRTGSVVPGAILECALRWNKYLVLFTTDDIPQEDKLHICLLDEAFQLLDQVNIGAMYSTGHLSQLRVAEPDEIYFRFIGDTDWSLRLSARPRFRISFLADPKGVSRPRGLSTHLQLKADPHPATS